jgi:tetratricopeptide (TPR) repeat protein
MLLHQVLHDEPRSPRSLNDSIPRDLQIICMAADLRLFLVGEPIRARPVSHVEKLWRWCRRKPAVAGLLAALVLVFLVGGSGVLWQWHRATLNAAAYQRERDTARQANKRAERHLQIVQDRVKELDRLGLELMQTSGKYRTGQGVLKEALAFYQDLLPEEGNDPEVRRQAAKLYAQVAWIHHLLGQEGEAAAAWDHQARLLVSLLEEEPASIDLRMGLADCHRWRGNALRYQGKGPEALGAYSHAAGLHEELLRESPDEPNYQVALANTLLNMAPLLSGQTAADEQERLYRRILELYRAAVRAAPHNPQFKAELALGLEGHTF